MKFIGALTLLLSFSTLAQTEVKCKGEYENSEAVIVEQMLPNIRHDFYPKLTSTVEDYLIPRISESTDLRIVVGKFVDNYGDDGFETIDIRGSFTDGSDFEVDFASFRLKKLFPVVKKAIQRVVAFRAEAYGFGQSISLKEFKQILARKEIRSIHTFYGLKAVTVGDGPYLYSCEIFFQGVPKK